jgi:maltodextrin utilization protein YvdJ
MTEPVTLTAAAIATLAFTKFVESGVGKLTEKFTEAALAKIEQLRQKIWEKLRGKPKAESALAAVEEKSSKEELGRLAVYLHDEMEDDPQFAEEVRVLAQEINAGKLQDNSTMVQNVYDNAKGWQTKVEGGTAYIGEINFHGKPPNP